MRMETHLEKEKQKNCTCQTTSGSGNTKEAFGGNDHVFHLCAELIVVFVWSEAVIDHDLRTQQSSS